MKPIILMLILWQLQLCVSARVNDNENISGSSSMAFKAGIEDSHIKDLYLAPGIFSGAVFSSEITYKIKTETSSQKITLKYGAGNLSSDTQPGEITQKSGLISYEYDIRLDDGAACKSPFEFYIGGGVSSYVSNSDLLLDNGRGQFNDQSWYWAHSINLIAFADCFLLSPDVLKMAIDIPVFSVVSRPKNGHWLNKRNQDVIYENFLNAALHGSGKFLWNSFNADISVEYTHLISDKAAFTCTYLFRYTTAEEPFKLNMYSNSIVAGIEFIF